MLSSLLHGIHRVALAVESVLQPQVLAAIPATPFNLVPGVTTVWKAAPA
jgi:hypothetical protein